MSAIRFEISIGMWEILSCWWGIGSGSDHHLHMYFLTIPCPFVEPMASLLFFFLDLPPNHHVGPFQFVSSLLAHNQLSLPPPCIDWPTTPCNITLFPSLFLLAHHWFVIPKYHLFTFNMQHSDCYSIVCYLSTYILTLHIPIIPYMHICSPIYELIHMWSFCSSWDFSGLVEIYRHAVQTRCLLFHIYIFWIFLKNWAWSANRT